MFRKQFYDVPSGDTVVYDVVDESAGYRQPPFPIPEDQRLDEFNAIKHVKCRDGDIFFNSYPKTGTNWLWEMLSLMLKNTSKVGEGTKGTGFMEARPLSVLEDMPSPRVLNTHIKIKYAPKGNFRFYLSGKPWEKKLKTVLVCRNPKDVAVSFYNHTKGITLYDYQGKFDNYLQMFQRGEVDYGSYPEYLLEWQQHIRDNPDVPVHIVYYEDLKEKGFEELKRLRDFLNLDVTEELLKEIVENCSINKMRESKEKLLDTKAAEIRKRMFRQGFTLQRKGQIGDWKNWFTVAQSEQFDAWWEKETQGLDMFKFRYN